MDDTCRLSNVTKDYLETYRCILQTMKKEMTEAELGSSLSDNFIVQMIPHHRAATQMSENILRFTTNLQVQDIAQQIVSGQTKSIENMEKILCRCGQFRNSRQEICIYQKKMEQIMQTMFQKMEHARFVNEINCNFMWEMIPHHRGAVEMAAFTLRCNICPELRPVLEAIYNSQTKGIAQMEEWLKCFGGQADRN